MHAVGGLTSRPGNPAAAWGPKGDGLPGPIAYWSTTIIAWLLLTGALGFAAQRVWARRNLGPLGIRRDGGLARPKDLGGLGGRLAYYAGVFLGEGRNSFDLSDFGMLYVGLGQAAITREIHDALKRRCLYHWVDYPSAERELAIIKSRVPGISAKLSQQVVRFVQALRDQDFYKSPGVAETIDWATALTELDARSLTPQVVGDTLGALLKYQDDIVRMQGDGLNKVLKEATSEN